MKYIENSKEFQCRNSVVTLGKFDGIHKGHGLLLEELRKYTDKTKVVFTFYEHPKTILEKQQKLLTLEEEKKNILAQEKIDMMVSYPFDEETRTMSPLTFIEQVLVSQLDAKVIVVGEDFCFGSRRSGNVALLKEVAKDYGFEVIAKEKLQLQGEIVSSSRIRKEMEQGNFSVVNDLLLYPYSIAGIVKEGKKLGRTIKMPTINIYPAPEKQLPGYGVYCSVVTVNEQQYPALTNIGIRPTVEDTNLPCIESYLLDYHGDLYGQQVTISLLKFLRPEQKFETLEELSSRMELDKIAAKDYFSVK